MFWTVKMGFYSLSLWVLTQTPCPIIFNCLFCMRQPQFCDLLVMFIFISFPVHEVLYLSTLFFVLPDFFYFIFFFLINNSWWWWWFLMLSFELWFNASCQKVFVEHVVNCPSFQKFQLKHSWTNVLWDSKRSISFLVQLLWRSVQLDILVLQLHIVSNFQSLRISFFLVELLLHILLYFFNWLCSLFPALL